MTRQYPKSLLEVRGKPIINYLIEKLAATRQVDEVFIVTNSKFIAHFRNWKKSVQLKKSVTLVNDMTKSNSDRLGAIGDVNFVINKKRIKEDLLIIGGDNLFSVGLKKFLRFAAKNRPAATIGLYKLKELKDASSYGVAKLDKNKRVVDFQEKPARPKSRLVAMCLYYLPGEILSLIKEYMRMSKKSDATGSYIDWLKQRKDTYGFVFSGSWYDVGDFKYLTAAKDNFAQS